MSLSLVHRSESRAPSAGSPSGHGLQLLALAWQASRGELGHTSSTTSTPVPRASRPAGQATEPPYWPDGPSAA
jgi:hypothetical protein